MNSTHYKPTRAADRTWEFTTPMGVSTGFFSEPEATRAAQRTEAADRTCALNNQGPLAKVLRPHFLPETQPPA
jgi:hypothetical protein